jgi:hypothetical protein
VSAAADAPITSLILIHKLGFIMSEGRDCAGRRIRGQRGLCRFASARDSALAARSRKRARSKAAPVSTMGAGCRSGCTRRGVQHGKNPRLQ